MSNARLVNKPMNDLSEQPLDSLVSALQTGSVRPQALLEAVVERFRNSAQALGAYLVWDPEFSHRQALAADAALAAGNPLGPLTGVPVSVKDHFGVAGLPVYAGTAQELPQKFRREGPVVRALRAGLAVITGKTHAVELAFGGIGSNSHWGTPRNPWDADRHRVPGGSSSGAGVSLQTGTAWLALGTDTGGSVRVPASMTGCVGFKTSAGRWSLDGVVPLSPTLDTAGLLARSVADLLYGCAVIDPVWRNDGVAGLRERLTAMRLQALTIGVADELAWAPCQEDISAVCREALGELEASGARLSDMPMPEIGPSGELLRTGSVLSAECDTFIEAELPAWRDRLDPMITMRINDGGTISAREYLLRRRKIEQLAAAANKRLKTVDVVAMPTLPLTPPTVAEVSEAGGYRRHNAAALGQTCVANFCHLCALSLPVGLDRAGLPVGLMLLARRGQELRLLGAALACERRLGSSRERLGRPPLA